MPSIYLTPMISCEPRFSMFIINGYCTKSLQSLDSLLKDVMYYCVLFDQTGNTVYEPVQWQNLSQYIKFIFTQRMSQDQFYSLLYCDRGKFNLAGGFFIFLFRVTGRGILFICSAEKVWLFQLEVRLKCLGSPYFMRKR